MDLRAPKLTRKSLKDVAERLRSLLRYLHRTGRISIDLSPHVIAPLLYAYEGVPSILERSQIAAVLESARKNTTPVGLRDHAILQLLATYGLRSSEVRNLRLEDIDWRAESIRIRHTKTRACSFLPLMEPVGEAVLAYLRAGRPATDAREIFIRTRAPYCKLGARIQEALDLRPDAIWFGAPGCVRLLGRGRKERICPLWPETVVLLKKLLERQPRAPDERMAPTLL
jgi:integrase/recombinase XerD